MIAKLGNLHDSSSTVGSMVVQPLYWDGIGVLFKAQLVISII